MPFCPNYKISFIHTPKTGGTSVSLYLKLKQLGHYRWEREKEINPSHTFFCIKRDPIDRALSSYYYGRCKKSYWHNSSNLHPDYTLLKNSSFDECVELLRERKLRHQSWSPQHVWSCENNNLQVDYVLRFENLEEDFQGFCRELEIPNMGELPFLNTSRRPATGNVSQAAKEILREFYAQDFEIFDYD
jgi:hypothetical protein